MATSFDLSSYRPDEHEVVPVGRPIANIDVYVLDVGLEPVADMSPGEICIEGVAVGAGYLDGSGSENERFVHTVVGGTVRTLYRTGDRGYVDQNGDLVVLGRMDAQLKVRGVRIDPVEIERSCAVSKESRRRPWLWSQRARNWNSSHSSCRATALSYQRHCARSSRPRCPGR